MTKEPPFTVVSATAADGSDRTEHVARGIALMLETMRYQKLNDQIIAYSEKVPLSPAEQMEVLCLAASLLGELASNHSEKSKAWAATAETP